MSTVTSVPRDTPSWMIDEIARGIFEKIEQDWCSELPGGDVALELGAGVGVVTRVLAERYRRVVAIEANVDLAPHWTANTQDVARSTRHNIELRCGVIGGRRFHAAGAEWWKSTVSTEPTTALGAIETRECPQLSVVDLICEIGPDAIMCDIEGAEMNSLRVAAETHWLDQVRDVIVELHPGLWDVHDAPGLERIAAEDVIGNRMRAAMTDAGFVTYREVRADGFPRGTPHPLRISHVWWRRPS